MMKKRKRLLRTRKRHKKTANASAHVTRNGQIAVSKLRHRHSCKPRVFGSPQNLFGRKVHHLYPIVEIDAVVPQQIRQIHGVSALLFHAHFAPAHDLRILPAPCLERLVEIGFSRVVFLQQRPFEIAQLANHVAVAHRSHEQRVGRVHRSLHRERILLFERSLEQSLQILKAKRGRRHRKPTVRVQQRCQSELAVVFFGRRRQNIHVDLPVRHQFVEGIVVDQKDVERLLALVQNAFDGDEQVRLVQVSGVARPERFPVARVHLTLYVDPEVRFPSVDVVVADKILFSVLVVLAFVERRFVLFVLAVYQQRRDRYPNHQQGFSVEQHTHLGYFFFLSLKLLMAKKGSKNIMWNVGFLLLILAIAVGSYQLLKREGMEGGEDDKKKIERVKNGNGMIVFTMEGCGWCDKVKPALEKLKQSEVKDHFAWVHKSKESTQEKLLKEYNVTSFPTILILKNGTSVPYEDNDREFESLLGEIKKVINR